MKDFKEYAQRKTAEMFQASVAKAEQAGRLNRYLPSARTDKEHVALDIAARDGIPEGLICILRTIEPCLTYQLHRNRQSKTLELELFQGKSLHLYHYWYDAYCVSTEPGVIDEPPASAIHIGFLSTKKMPSPDRKTGGIPK